LAGGWSVWLDAKQALRNLQQGANKQDSSVYHLHLFKSSVLDECESERLGVDDQSVVCVADQEVTGK
jgi:hypothetical protein